MRLQHKQLESASRFTDKTSESDMVRPGDIGTVLANILKETLKITNKYDCKVNLIDVKFHKKMDDHQNFKYFTINPAFIDYMTEEMDDVKLLHLDKALPTIMKPAKWSSHEVGGYYLKATNLVKIENSREQEEAIKHADLSRTFNVLQVLSGVPWKINKRVFGVVEAIWNEGGGVSNIPYKAGKSAERVYDH